MKTIASIVLSAFLMSGTAFADTPKDADAQPAKTAQPAKPKAAKKAATKTESKDATLGAEIEELRQTLQSQQEQLSLLKEELAKRDHEIDLAREAAAAANSRAAEANSKAAEAVDASAEAKSTEATLTNTVSDLKASNAALKTSVDATRATLTGGEGTDGPAAIYYKGIAITPGGFIAAETVFRTKTIGAIINTPFTSTPYSGNAGSNLTEFNATGQQSRLSLLAEGMAGTTKIGGYWEADFLGVGTTSNPRQSNSYVLRDRQLFAEAKFASGLNITGGQMWSLVTETKKGEDNRTEASPMGIDAAYHVGFSYARQYGFRVVQNFDDNKFAFGFSVENPQTTFSVTNPQTNVLAIDACQNSGTCNQLDTTGYSINRMPDFIFKMTADPGWGHYELFGLFSSFRGLVYPCSDKTPGFTVPTGCGAAPTTGQFQSNPNGGGIGANVRVPVFAKKLDVGLHALYGVGVGRYGSAQLPDVTERPNGSLVPIRNGQGLLTLEYHATKKLDLYAYAGMEFDSRTSYTLTNGAAVGYGSPFFEEYGCNISTPGVNGAAGTNGSTLPAGCTGNIRNIIEGTIGFWHKFYSGPMGRLQWGIQYSYLTKNTWAGNNAFVPGSTGPGQNASYVFGPNFSPNAINNMFFTSLRYYIP